jgi:hypothetical protein
MGFEDLHGATPALDRGAGDLPHVGVQVRDRDHTKGAILLRLDKHRGPSLKAPTLQSRGKCDDVAIANSTNLDDSHAPRASCVGIHGIYAPAGRDASPIQFATTLQVGRAAPPGDATHDCGRE